MDDDLEGQFARMGATVKLQGAPVAAQPDIFEVMRANDDAITAWIACETQWMLAPGDRVRWMGLNYPAVDVVLRRGRFADPDQVFADLQVMEGAALDTFWEKPE